MSLPSSTSVLVIGGGPAGSTAASLLAREGIDVVLCERDRFPRYHIGESMLPGVVPLLRFMGVFDEIDRHMIRKHGAWFKIKADIPPGVIEWKDISDSPYAWNVERATFDNILLTHAERSGAKVFQEVAINSLSTEGGRFVSADWEHRDGRRGFIDFDYVIDGSGMAGLIATKYHRDRVFQENFNNIAIGSYWEGASEYEDPRGIRIEGAPFAESFLDGTGWIWTIPIPGRLSVGVIMHVDRFREVRRKFANLTDLLLSEIDRSVETKAVLKNAKRIGEVRTWRDYSYASLKFAGPNYRLAGDAAAFIDPLFSQGIHMALLGGLSSAATVCSSLRKEWPEEAMIHYHDTYIRRAYTHFIVVLAGWYRQIRNQSKVVLHGVSADNYQIAFDMVRPVISGLADGIGDNQRVSDQVLDRTMEYMTDLQLELHHIETGDAVAKDLARSIKSQVDNMGTSPQSAIGGYHVRLEQGRLGMARA